MEDRKKLIEGLLNNMHAMRHKLMVGYARANDTPITPSQGFVLRFVATNKSANVKALAEALHVTSSAATQLVDGLVEKEYLARGEDPNDRRMCTLLLTEKAKKEFKEFKEQGLAKMTELFSVLSDQELATFARLNKKIAESIDTETC